MIISRHITIGCDMPGCLWVCRVPLVGAQTTRPELPVGWQGRNQRHACPRHAAEMFPPRWGEETKRARIDAAIAEAGWPGRRLPKGWVKEQAERLRMSVGYINTLLRHYWYAAERSRRYAEYLGD